MTGEYARFAADARDRLGDLDRADAIAQACRGSGNPALLAWLAEAIGIGPTTRVVDVGGGLGGPAAWLHDRYDCPVFVTDPVAAACAVATEVFGVPAMAADGAAMPLPSGRFDVALYLGVLSVVDMPAAVLTEGRRIADRLASIAYVSTSAEAVEAGGSRFLPVPDLTRLLRATGWELETGPAAPGLPPPPSWQSDGGAEDADARAVLAAIGEGRIQAVVATARSH